MVDQLSELADSSADDSSKLRVMFSPDGSSYKGTWLGGNKHGLGTYVFPNGDVYQGYFANNTFCGYGEFYRYIDDTLNQNVDLLNVEAVRGRNPIASLAKKKTSLIRDIPKDPSNEPTLKLVYAGDFKDGKRHGFGKYIYDDNDIYQGQWIYGYRHGFGTHFQPPEKSNNVMEENQYKFGPIYRGYWQRDVKQSPNMGTVDDQSTGDENSAISISSAKNGFNYMCRTVFPNGNLFIGSYVSNVPSGPGVYYDVKRRCITRGFWFRGRNIAGAVQYGFGLHDIRAVLAGWVEPYAPWPGISENMRWCIRRFLATTAGIIKASLANASHTAKLTNESYPLGGIAKIYEQVGLQFLPTAGSEDDKSGNMAARIECGSQEESYYRAVCEDAFVTVVRKSEEMIEKRINSESMAVQKKDARLLQQSHLKTSKQSILGANTQGLSVSQMSVDVNDYAEKPSLTNNNNKRQQGSTEKSQNKTEDYDYIDEFFCNIVKTGRESMAQFDIESSKSQQQKKDSNNKNEASSLLKQAITYNHDAIEETNKISEEELGVIGNDFGLREAEENKLDQRQTNRARAYVSSALSDNTTMEYPYMFQPEDEMDENGDKIVFKNFSELHAALPIHKAKPRTQIEEVLDLPIDTHNLILPKNRLYNPNATVAESIRAVIEELMLLEDAVPVIREMPQPYDY